MANSKSKKGRNPGAVDNWLDSIGLYRKNVAYDETCLFRAVSEQLFDCQIYHERIRRECVDYGRKNFFEFWDLLEDEEQWYDHMDLLEKHMVVCGNIEIQIISRKYNRDVLVFDAAHQQLHDFTNRELKDNLMLCLMNEDHYDVVYKRDHIQNAGFSQSIIYQVLYENVFEVENVPEIVHGMLYEKEFVSVPFSEIDINSNENNLLNENDTDGKYSNGDSATNIAPFPFKVAKALDPTIYRNIEYDSWTEVRREMRLGEWYYGDDHLILGTRCIYNSNDETYECYIQEIIKDENKCIIYVTKLAEKRLVNYTDLSPENDAKPWPLPYRFSKNLVISHQPPEKPIKLPKRRKDKRRNKCNSESSAQSHNLAHQEGDSNVKAFVGVPLQMQHSVESTFTPSTPQTSPVELPGMSLSQHNLLVTPDIPSPMPKFSWEAPWNHYLQHNNEQVIWSTPPGAPQNMYNYNIKPMIASAPVTPDAIPYQGINNNHYPFVYNYPVENYNQYGAWGPPQEYSHQPQEIAHNEFEEEAKYSENNNNQSGDSGQFSYCTSLPPQSPQIELYSPLTPFPPGTPVIYAHTPDIGDVLVPANPMQMYTPAVDMQYVSPGPYMYPTTPTTAWYTPGINSQGFIFPAPVNQK